MWIKGQLTPQYGKRETENSPRLPRRDFLRLSGLGLGSLAFTGLLQDDGHSRTQEPNGNLPNLDPKAKSVIFLFMYGGPSAIDTFDPKPELDRLDGVSPPQGIETFFTDNGNLMKSPYRFKQHGESGAWVSELYPALAHHVDEIAFVKSMHCESNNHAPALLELNSGMTRVGFPSMGSWVTYGLGSENRDLPGFMVMYDHRGGPIAGPQNWGAGFLPGKYQGTPLRSEGTPLLNLQLPAELDRYRQREQLDLLSLWNRRHAGERPEIEELEARIQSYELAYRMQLAAPEALDFSKETTATKKLYGLEEERTRYFGVQCLMARRLIERGVRFVQLYSGGGHQQESWDAHYGLKPNHDLHCAETDVPIAGLLTDLKQRGLLEQTLVVWGGEFGRMPMSQGENRGRDHNPDGFLIWMAGGGTKGGVQYGATDDIGHRAVHKPVSVNDLHATILHLLGVDHERLTYFHNGRDFRLTDVAGKVLYPILA